MMIKGNRAWRFSPAQVFAGAQGIVVNKRGALKWRLYKHMLQVLYAHYGSGLPSYCKISVETIPKYIKNVHWHVVSHYYLKPTDIMHTQQQVQCVIQSEDRSATNPLYNMA